MLRDLRKAEYESEMVFILTEKDILVLVQKIWESRSAVSNSDEELVLTRWDFSKPWTPWNSFLVTKDELPAHRAISNAGEGYVQKSYLIMQMVLYFRFGVSILQSNSIKWEFFVELIFRKVPLNEVFFGQTTKRSRYSIFFSRH